MSINEKTAIRLSIESTATTLSKQLSEWNYEITNCQPPLIDPPSELEFRHLSNETGFSHLFWP